MKIESGMRHIDKISSISGGSQDDIFIACASFEDRCLGSMQKFNNYKPKKIVIFEFEENNPAREKNLIELENIIDRTGLRNSYKKLSVTHGMTTNGILNLHNYFKENNLSNSKNLSITLDITTFTKELLLEVLFYLTNIVKFQKMRILYTIPSKYASPEEGPLSYGISNIKIVPFFWNNWTATKDDLLMVILGYEEMRAWSLISRFDANGNRLFITKPGSKPEWDMHCENYNKRLLKENFERAEMPSMDPLSVAKILEEQIARENLYNKYNIFIAPLGTKPQILGVFCFLTNNPEIRANIVSTTAIDHNFPYYSSGIGDTFYTMIQNQN